MKEKKIVVFDMDETLGSFVQLGIFWDALQEYFFHSLTDKDFNELMDKNPEFIRPKIISILKYLKNKKQKKHLTNVYIYTNNQGPKSWALKIKRYFEHKISYKLFDKVIGAFKIKGNQVEKCRTTHKKTVSDLLHCTYLNNDKVKICFIDDQYHHSMKHEIVNYIHIKPYSYDLSYDLLIKRFLTTTVGKNILNDKDKFTLFIKSFISEYRYEIKSKNDNELIIDKIASKKMMLFIQDFFKNDHSPKTFKKNKKKKQSKTIKKKL